jgi:hypothetical protein
MNTVHYNMEPLDNRLAMGWTIHEPNPCDGEIFRTRQVWLWNPPVLLPGGKTAGEWC